MASIVIPRLVIEDDAPQPLHTRTVTIVEGINPDGETWVRLVSDSGMPAEERTRLIELAANTFPTMRTGPTTAVDLAQLRCRFATSGCTIDHLDDDRESGALCDVPIGLVEATCGGDVEVSACWWSDTHETVPQVAIGVGGMAPAELTPAAARRVAARLIAAADRAEVKA